MATNSSDKPQATNTFNERSELVRRLVSTNFHGYEEPELRNLQWCVLQMLAPLCSPPNRVAPRDVESIVRVVLEAKREIEVLEYERKRSTPPIQKRDQQQPERPVSVSAEFVPMRVTGFVCPVPRRAMAPVPE